ncbi:chemotaxis protein CheW [Sphingomonadaceae bacterium G21617-S1]|jgi:purine-binding chemotaxis protein CheW|uniref:chemotaxis protein CheW n=1 Tax=Rhizorhabdus sp. TaxID=1968843 RepID=UPI0012042634|nr:chemotaxis protein CheW [Rhizorhabdus sp.]MBD3761966.1 chemotaxis protein CheW [Rhizorhabdus sp.]MCZ4340874.1 chemotaxis protein CheW [Sphingomonadaceae bacterium G21617-S1]TAK10937.1 MAG: chemotaxis protein CheW [Rhizorhabdus sp.]
MNDLYLIVEIAGQRAALPAAFVESVVEIEEIAPVPCAPSHVFGLFALRSRVLTVIDTIAALGGDRSAPGEKQAVIVHVDGHLYGLLVDDVDDVVAIEGVPTQPRALLAAGWARYSKGVFEHDGDPLLLIDVAAMIAGPLELAA